MNYGSHLKKILVYVLIEISNTEFIFVGSKDL